MSDRRMWPTPRTSDIAAGRRLDRHGNRTNLAGTMVYGANLSDAVTWTPPDVQDVSQPSMFSAEDFPASPTPWLANVAELPTRATSGPSTPDSFASLDPDGSWRKTCQGYSQMTLDGSLEAFSETWPRAGMTRSGTAYQLVPLAPLTGGIASGSWPTPTANDYKNAGYQTANGRVYVTLPGATGSAPVKWPTLKSSPSGPDYARRNREGSGGDDLATVVGGQLNPTWVEWLQGYPLGWTEVD